MAALALVSAVVWTVCAAAAGSLVVRQLAVATRRRAAQCRRRLRLAIEVAAAAAAPPYGSGRVGRGDGGDGAGVGGAASGWVWGQGPEAGKGEDRGLKQGKASEEGAVRWVGTAQPRHCACWCSM